MSTSPRNRPASEALVAGAVVVLGSATPSMESFANAKSGKYTLLELPERVDNQKMPRVRVVVEVPKKLTKKQEELLREFARQTGESAS